MQANYLKIYTNYKEKTRYYEIDKERKIIVKTMKVKKISKISSNLEIFKY